FINELGYNWNSRASDVVRAHRDRSSLAFLHQWTLAMPWFVLYRFPADFVGSGLCWRGEVLWERADGTFDTIAHADMQCRTLTPDDVGRDIFGVSIAHSLAMRLVPTWQVRLRQLVEPGLPLLALATALALLVRVRGRRVVLPFALIAVTLLVAMFNDASFLGSMRPFDSGDDGLVYDGYARMMLRQLVAGDVGGALKGVEPVFYFTPGLRYLRAAEHLIFGESYLGYLSLILLLPFLVFALAAADMGDRGDIGVRGGSGRRALRLEPGAIREMGGARLCRSRRLHLFSRRLRAAARPTGRRAARPLRARLRRWAPLRARLVRAAEHRAGGGHLARGRRARGAGAAPVSPRRRPRRRLPGGVGHGAAQLGLRRRARLVPHHRRASAPVADAAVGLSRRDRRARAFEFRRRVRGARAAADRRLARRPVRNDRDGAAQRGGDSRAGARCVVAKGRPVAAPDRPRHLGAARRRALLSRRRPLPLSDLAAHAAGGGGVGARRRTRDRAPVVSPCHRAGGEASRKPRARARPQQHVRYAARIMRSVRACGINSSGELGLLPPPQAGKGWGGGELARMSLVACPLPIPPPQAGEGSAPSTREGAHRVPGASSRRLAADFDHDDVGPLLQARAGGGGHAGDNPLRRQRAGQGVRGR